MEPQEGLQPGVQETVLAQWQQPSPTGMLSGRTGLGTIWLFALVVAAGLIAIAIWQHELNFGLAGGVILLAAVALQTQRRAAALPVSITTSRIVIGKRDYPLATLAGFWLADQGDVVEVNLETAKPGLLPMTFLYAKPSLEEARAVLGQVLPELQPREKKAGDRLNKFLRL